MTTPLMSKLVSESVSGEAGRIRFVCCGPSLNSELVCPIGARVSGPCAHGVAGLLAGCVLASQPVS